MVAVDGGPYSPNFVARLKRDFPQAEMLHQLIDNGQPIGDYLRGLRVYVDDNDAIGADRAKLESLAKTRIRNMMIGNYLLELQLPPRSQPTGQICDNCGGEIRSYPQFGGAELAFCPTCGADAPRAQTKE